MKLFVASLIAEVNTFAAAPTGWGAFEAEGLRRGADSTANPGGVAAALEAVRSVAAPYGATVVEGLCAAALPLGRVVEAVYQQLRAEILEGLAAAMPIDAVVLLLHGAMVSDECDDCEGDLVEAVRGVVGPACPIGVELDPHCHFTDRLRRGADVIVAYKEYPHTDIAEQAAAVTRLALDTACGRIRPVLGEFDCRMVGLFPTVREPMKSFVAEMRAREGTDGILAVSLGHGFAYGDVPESGAKVWVIADGDQARADSVAAEIGRRFWSLRDEVSTRPISIAAALDRVARHDGPLPLALADLADNPGGGARGDSTFLLCAVLARRLGGIAIGGFWDPGAVQICLEAGVGARFPLRIGGKCGPASGDPVDIVVTVRGISEHHEQSDFGQMAPLGPSAFVSTDDGVDIVLISRCQQVLGVEMFNGLGVALQGKRAIIVKSTQHFAAAFAPFVSEILHVDSPGLLRCDYENIPYRRRSLAYWPRIADPFIA